MQGHLDMALVQGLLERQVFGVLEAATVPDHDGAAAVFVLRDGALELGVIEGMVLGAHGQALGRGVEGRPLGHGPGQQHAVALQAQVVVQPAGVVLLDDVQVALAPCLAGLRLGRPVQTPLLVVLVQRHVSSTALSISPLPARRNRPGSVDTFPTWP